MTNIKDKLNEKFKNLHKKKIVEKFQNSLETQSSSALQKTNTFVSQANTDVTMKVQELQSLQTKFNDTLQKYNASNSNLLNSSKDYIQKNSFQKTQNKNINTNIYASQMLSTVPTEKYIGCYNDTDNRAMTTIALDGAEKSFDDCKTAAVNGGYKYFGTQYPTGEDLAQCFLSNDLTSTTQYGVAVNINSKALWSTGTAGSGVVSVGLYNTGNILLLDGNGNVVDPVNADPQPGGVPNKSGPADCLWSGSINLDSLSATYGGNCHVPQGNVTSQVVGLINGTGQNSTSLSNSTPYTSGTTIIPVSNNTFGDPAVGCAKGFDIGYQCGNVNQTKHLDYAEGQNVLLDCSSQFKSCKFFLILQDDGNMCIYRGTPDNNNNNNTAVWCAMTNGQQQQPNQDFAASKSKFGRNYMLSGETLNTDEWISSNDGSLFLIMQSDGNLVLYTTTSTSKCSIQSNGKAYGGVWANSVHELSEVGDLNNLNKIGYVDDNGNLTQYPSSMISMDENNNIVLNNDISCNKNVKNVDTLEWNKFNLSSTQMTPTTTCGLTNATSAQQQEAEQLRQQLVELANQIVQKITYLETLNSNMISQMGIDKNVLDANLKKYKQLSSKFSILNGQDISNINQIVDDSEINVKKYNYTYILWGILAIIIILITIKILRY